MIDFLTLYIVAAAAAVVVALLRRRRALAGQDTGSATGSLGPYEIAYLNGGATRAVTAASAALHQQGVLDGDGDRQLAATGTLPPGAHRLERAVLRAVESDNAASGRVLRDNYRVRTVLKDLAQDLFRDGLLIGAAARRQARWASWPVLAVLALGLVRLATGDPQVAGLVLAVIAVAVAQIALLTWRIPVLTRRGQDALATSREQNQHLAPASNPAWATYGPVGAAMGVALFGTAALWSAEPAFAADLDMPPFRESVGGSGIDTFIHRDPSCGTTDTYGCGGGAAGGGCGGGGGGGGGGGCGGGGGT